MRGLPGQKLQLALPARLFYYLVTYRRQDFWFGNNASSPAPEWDLEIIVIWD